VVLLTQKEAYLFETILHFFQHVIEIFFHLDVHLNTWISFFGLWIYVILFLILFCETGLVVTPFLPGDSLLFTLGALAATDQTVLKLSVLLMVLIAAAIFGDAVNYMIGSRIGPRIFRSEKSRWLNKKHLISTQQFYDRHGGKTIIFARFLPIFRTFAPFVAGIGKMHYPRFALFNITGGIVWVLSFLLLGFYFGNIPVMKKHFEFVILGIIFISMLPMIFRIVLHRLQKA